MISIAIFLSTLVKHKGLFMKNINIRILIALCLAMLCLVACNKKAEEPAKTDNASAEQQIPPDPDIDPKAIIGIWTQTVDDADVYTFMEDGKCTLANKAAKTSKDCTYELLTPAKASSRFNMLIVRYPATDTEEAYENRIKIRLSGDMLETPYDNEGNVNEYNRFKKTDSNAAQADAPKDTEVAYEGKIEEDILGEWSEEVSEGPTVTYKFMPEGKCTYQAVMNPKGVDCTYKISDRTGNQFKLIVTREDALGGMKDFEETIEFKDGNLYFYVDNHPYKYNKK